MKKNLTDDNIFFVLNVFNTAKTNLMINTGWTQKMLSSKGSFV